MSERKTHLRWSFALAIALTVFFVVLPFAMGGGAEPLLDRHSDPAPRVRTAWVAASGKLYHDPRCTFIHGRPVMEPAATAVANGLSPCPRCLGTLRVNVVASPGARTLMVVLAGLL